LLPSLAGWLADERARPDRRQAPQRRLIEGGNLLQLLREVRTARGYVHQPPGGPRAQATTTTTTARF
jgi:hypothetical protein